MEAGKIVAKIQTPNGGTFTVHAIVGDLFAAKKKLHELAMFKNVVTAVFQSGNIVTQLV